MTTVNDLSKTCDWGSKNRTERQEIIVGWNKLEAAGQQEISFQFWSEVWAQHCYFTMEYWILLRKCEIYLTTVRFSYRVILNPHHRAFQSRIAPLDYRILGNMGGASEVGSLWSWKYFSLCMFLFGRKSIIVKPHWWSPLEAATFLPLQPIKF